MDEMDSDGDFIENLKHKDFIDEFTHYGKCFGKNPGQARSICYKFANNIKINHIMVSFTDHYNAISINRLPSKTKT